MPAPEHNPSSRARQTLPPRAIERALSGRRAIHLPTLVPALLLTAFGGLPLLLLAAGQPLAALGADGCPSLLSLQQYALARIEITGIGKVPRARVLAIAGLTLNTMVTRRDVEAATARLADSGLFSAAGHRYRMVGHSLIVTFVLTEESWTTPALFDNFVDDADGDLAARIATQWPLFEGGVPDRIRVLDQIASFLERVARERTPSATVSYVGVAETAVRPRHYRFRVEVPGRPTPICRVEVEGVAGERLAQARERLGGLLSKEYSRDFVEQFAFHNLLSGSRRGGGEVGRVREVRVRRGTALDSCGNGVVVTIVIDGGAGPVADAGRPPVREYPDLIRDDRRLPSSP